MQLREVNRKWEHNFLCVPNATVFFCHKNFTVFNFKRRIKDRLLYEMESSEDRFCVEFDLELAMWPKCYYYIILLSTLILFALCLAIKFYYSWKNGASNFSDGQDVNIMQFLFYLEGFLMMITFLKISRSLNSKLFMIGLSTQSNCKILCRKHTFMTWDQVIRRSH